MLRGSTPPAPKVIYPSSHRIQTRVTVTMASASSNQWAALGDAVNSASLVDFGVNIVRVSLPVVSVVGAATKVYTRGAGGYCDRLSELDMIIQSWDTFLNRLTPNMEACIDADAGAGSVALMRLRLSSVNAMFGRLKNKHATSSFWEKVSFRENTLSQEYIFVKELVDAADLYFKASTDSASLELMQSMLAEARQAQRQSTHGAIPIATFAPPPNAHVHAGHGAPGMLPLPASARSYHAGRPAMPIAPDLAANAFDQLVQFTVAFLGPFTRRRGNQRGNQHRTQAPPPRGYNRV